MADKEKIIKKKIRSHGLSDNLFGIVLDKLEDALSNRPVWLKVLHFFRGNAGWIEDTVLEIIERIQDTKNQSVGSE